MNKKAGIPDMIFFVIALFAVAIISIVGYTIMSNINTNFQGSSGISQEGKNMVSTLNSKYVSIVDQSFLIIFVGLLIAIVVGAYFIYVHPALFWISTPLLAFIIFLAAIYANVFNVMTDGTQLSDSASSFTFIPLIFDNYVIIVTVSIILVTIALFAKNRSQML